MLQVLKKVIKRHRYPLLILLFTWGIFFVYIFSKMILLNSQGLFLGHPNAWSDWALHIGIANIFAHKSPDTWFSYHPLFAGGKFTYPFVMDMISGLLMRLGLSLSFSFIIPSIFFSGILIFSMYGLFYLLSKSRAVSVLSIFVFFFSSGLGFLNFIHDFLNSPNIDFILHPIRQYSQMNAYEWYTGNVLVGLIIPQRAFLMGLSVGLLSLVLLLTVILQPFSNKKINHAVLVFSGVIAGILPIIHPHSFIAITLIAGLVCLVNLRKLKLIAYFFVPAGIISSSLTCIFILGGIQSNSFFTFLPGWTSKNILDFIYMWINFWSLILPLSAFGAYKLIKSDSTIKAVLSGFILIFILGNLFLFQPIKWDNTKLFWWSYIGFCFLSSIVMVGTFRKNFMLKILTVFLILSVTLTGVLEIIKLLDFSKNTYLLTSSEDILLGNKIGQNTRPLDIFVTAPKHNTIIMVWAARPILLGYTAWAYNFGFDYSKREQDIADIYKGGEKARSLLSKYSVNYILVGPSELEEEKANEEFFSKNYPLAFSDSQNRVYKIKD